MEGFAERLRAARRRTGMSQGDLQRASGVPKSRLSRYENGHLLPSLTTLERIARAIGIPQGELLDPREANSGAFLDELRDRGVEFDSTTDARDSADRFADMLEDERDEQEAGAQ
jgi:transcriptional regulator with XRE-family HTH domain